MNATTDEFTKSLFCMLHMDWNELARAREVLNSIIPKEESLETVIEDVVFSLSCFLEFVLKGKNIENKLRPYFVCQDFVYHVFIGTDEDDEVPFCQEAFLISDAGVNEENIDIFIFEKTDYDRTAHTICLEGLDETKEILLFWFNEFYAKVEEGML